MQATNKKAFTQTGGCRIGKNSWLALNATVPFATLVVSEGNLTLKALSKIYVFEKADVQRIVDYSGLFSQGVQIQHTVAKYPKFVVFWTFKLDELRVNLQTSGFHLEQ